MTRIGQLMDSFNVMAEADAQGASGGRVLALRFLQCRPKCCPILAASNCSSKKVVASAMFADIVGFTSIRKIMNRMKVAALLNEYFLLRLAGRAVL